MSVLYIAVPAALMLSASAVLAFVWVVRTGQLDDLETPPFRAIFEDPPDLGIKDSPFGNSQTST